MIIVYYDWYFLLVLFIFFYWLNYNEKSISIIDGKIILMHKEIYWFVDSFLINYVIFGLFSLTQKYKTENTS